LKKLYVFWLKILSEVLVAAYWIYGSHFYRWLTSQFASSSPSSIVSVAPFRQREIAGISCRLQSNSDTDIFNVAAEKPAICARNWFMKEPDVCKRLEKSTTAAEQVLSICHVYCCSLLCRHEKGSCFAERRGT
jgi:hypothetical protein